MLSQVRNSMDEAEELGEAGFAAEQQSAVSAAESSAAAPDQAEPESGAEGASSSDRSAQHAEEHMRSTWQRLKGLLPGRGGQGEDGAAGQQGRPAGHAAEAGLGRAQPHLAGGQLSAGRILERGASSSQSSKGSDELAAQLFGPTPGAAAAAGQSQPAKSGSDDGEARPSLRELPQEERDAQYAAAMRAQAAAARSRLEQVTHASLEVLHAL